MTDAARARFAPLALRFAAETQAVLDFFAAADELGLPVPDRKWIWNNAAEAVSCLLTASREGHGLRPRPKWDHFRSFVLAQHHGIPTRLLDWTLRPWVAAFFAASEAVENGISGSLAVWALYIPALRTLPIEEPATGIVVLEAPRARHAYLHAQSGLFTLDTTGDGYFTDPPASPRHGWPSLDETLESFGKRGFLRDFPLRKFELPVARAPELLRALAAEGISRMHLMPGYDSIWPTLSLTARAAQIESAHEPMRGTRKRPGASRR